MDRIRVSENKQVVLLIGAIYIVCILVFWPLMTWDTYLVSCHCRSTYVFS